MMGFYAEDKALTSAPLTTQAKQAPQWFGPYTVTVNDGQLDLHVKDLGELMRTR